MLEILPTFPAKPQPSKIEVLCEFRDEKDKTRDR
jgi:hypothetical protein